MASMSFYEGLLTQDRLTADDTDTEVNLFISALESSNPFIRDAAAEQLILPLLHDEVDILPLLTLLQKNIYPPGAAEVSLQKAALYLLDQYEGDDSPGSVWDTALRLFADMQHTSAGTAAASTAELKEQALDFLCNTEMGEAVRWTIEGARRMLPPFFTDIEAAALDGRLAVSRSDFAAGLTLFREVLAGEPALFLRYPGLLTDLGRCLQFASTGTEGVDILLDLDRLPQDHLASGAQEVRYRLYYFAGRISRQREQYRKAREFFTQAIPLAPDPLQSDACTWYILSTALADKSMSSGDCAALTAFYIPRWDDDPYFSDILDRLSRRLATEGQWQIIADILTLIRDGSDRVSIAKYAYITGRAIMLGYIPSITADSMNAARPYFQLAYNAGESSWYYRALSASFLEKPLLSLPPARTDSGRGGTTAFPHPVEMAFLLGFFQSGAASKINPYLKKISADLSIPELRALAEAFSDTEMYPELLRLVQEYMDRKDYKLNRRDLELFYPRPFLEVVEEKARAADLSPELLYGLIRTESAFQADIISRAGAVGLTQLMPATAVEMADRIRRSRSHEGEGGPAYVKDGAVDLQNPEINIHIGAVYLSYLMDRMAHPLLAILAYNGGMNRVRRWYGAVSLPGDIFLETVEYPETREYGRRVFSAAAIYGYLFYDMNMEQLFTDICK
ncbi:hypothetical protein FACS189491_10430 [Spirochaetia bacterium]|nr:hypothetical protein FACS189491_10430 [Spirochaetia bacterium]